MASQMYVLETKNLTKTYKIRGHNFDVLKDVSLKIEVGEIVAIEGSSGSGKTTLLSLLSDLDQPSNGRVLVTDQDITDKSGDELAPVRNQTVGFVFQSFHLVPSLTVIENIIFPAEPTGNLDSTNSAEILELLFELHREQGTMLVVVTHDMNIV